MTKDTFRLRIQGDGDHDCMIIDIPLVAVSQHSEFFVVEVEKMDIGSRSQFAGWLRGASSWLLGKL